MTTVVLLRLDWPAPELWQNRRVHWSRRSKAVASARKAAWAEANNRGIRNLPRGDGQLYRLYFSFYPPDRRKRDLHNMPATQKAAIDGIADALGVDDSRFRCVWPEEFDTHCPGNGSVLCEVRAIDAE